MVRADTLSPKALIHAMEAGDFYASTGVTLENLTHSDKKISVEVKPEAGISYTISFIGCRKGAVEAEELMRMEGTKADFELDDGLLFVRAKVVSSKRQDNPIEDMLYEMAWTQPVSMD